jgi:plasmid stabilization system protein ParE
MKDSPANLWSPAAREDFRSIYVYYTRLASHEVALNLLQEIERVAAHIADGRAEFRERDDLIAGIRAVAVRPYIVFYRVTGGVPQIVRVLHERQESERILRRQRKK